MHNNLINVTPGVPTKIRLYIQFIADVFPQRALPCINKNGNQVSRWMVAIYDDILVEFNTYSLKCLNYDIEMILRPRNSQPNVLGANWMDFRDPTEHNPFHPVNQTSLPLPKDWQEIDAANNTVAGTPVLPLVRFYIGDGESLNIDIEGRGNDPIFNAGAAAARIQHNLNNGYDKVIPGYENRYANRTSFFAPHLRAGYLFTNSGDQIETVFMHELGHVLGLSDRYIEGIDESTTADEVFGFVGWPARQNPPLSSQHINSIPSPGVSGPDADYDPQNNLMGSRSYVLSARQRSIIEIAETEATYVKDDVVLLLSLNDHAERKLADIPPDEPNANAATACRKTETHYFPSTVSVNPLTNLDHATFVNANNVTEPHNAFFRAPSGSPLKVRYDGDVKTLRKLMKGALPLAGFETRRSIYRQLGII